MKNSLIAICLLGICLFIVGFFVPLLFPLLEILGFSLSIYGLLKDFFESKKQKEKDIKILSGQAKLIKIQKEIKKNTSHILYIEKILNEEFTSRKILDRIRKSLKGKLTTSDIIDELDNPLYAMIIHKWGEPPQEKIIRDRLYNLGFKDLGQGVKILPPSKMPKGLRTREDIKKWLKQNVLRDLPKYFKYSIIYATLIDLRKVYAEKSAPKEWAHRFRGQTIFDRLSWDELFPPEFIRKTIQTKLKVSIEELINEYLPLPFLLSRHLEDDDLVKILKKKEEIVEEIKKTFNLNRLLLIDFADMDNHKLSKLLSKYGIKNSKIVAEKMIDEATIWKQFLS